MVTFSLPFTLEAVRCAIPDELPPTPVFNKLPKTLRIKRTGTAPISRLSILWHQSKLLLPHQAGANPEGANPEVGV